MTAGAFGCGLDTLFRPHSRRWKGRPLALLTHLAALDSRGVSSVERLATTPGLDLRVVFAPEHGLLGTADAGESVPDIHHPVWNVPVHSLYGTRRAPSPGDWGGAELAVVDLQDLGVRPYTYVSTLLLFLRAAAAAGLPVVVADRPIPLPHAVDGPLVDPGMESFVAAIPAPMSYAMTPAETALWLRDRLGLRLDLDVAPLHGAAAPGMSARGGGPPWVPPSPGIRSVQSAAAYAATVFTEALPACDCGRTGPLPFQVVGAPGLRARRLAAAMNSLRLPGVRFHAHAFFGTTPVTRGTLLEGVRLVVAPDRFKPILTSVCLVAEIQAAIGSDALWNAPGTRPAWFDALYGSPRVREALQAGKDGRRVAACWARDCTAFRRTRNRYLLYPRT